MPVFVIIVLVLLAVFFKSTGALGHMARKLMKSALAVVVIMAIIIFWVMAWSSIQIP